MTDDSNTTATSSGPLNRRTVLAVGGAATASAALVITGCSTYSPQQSAPAADSPSSGSAPDADGSAPDLGPVTAIPVGGGRVFPNQQVVVTQPTAGTYKAFSAVCTHAGCTVGSVSGGTINCPCHGSKFNITDGSVANGPAKQPLPAKQVDADGGTLRLT